MVSALIFPEYFSETDTINLIVQEGKISESDFVTPHLLVDYGADSSILQLDISMAKKILYHFCEKYTCETTPSHKIIMIGDYSIIQRSFILKTDDSRINIMHYDQKWTAIILNK